MPRTATDGNLAILRKERTILDTMLRAKNSRQKVHIVIPRVDEDGESFEIDFYIRPLNATELRECSMRAANFGQEPQAGGLIMPILDPMQEELANSYLVIEATIPGPDEPSGAKTMWYDQSVLDAFGVVDAGLLVDEVLLGYEKMAVVAKINEISGGTISMAKLVESAKN